MSLLGQGPAKPGQGGDTSFPGSLRGLGGVMMMMVTLQRQNPAQVIDPLARLYRWEILSPPPQKERRNTVQMI